MEQIILAFITGLTTGGLSCLAVQGGLLATSLARQIELDLLNQPLARARDARRARGSQRLNAALPIVLFLASKLAAYTVLGLLLGLVGSFLTLDPITRAILMIAIGIFMIGNGLRMLNVHPIFRVFNLQAPRFITRYIRRTARGGTELVTPLWLGALTVLIPCGVTQAMMAAALGSGDPATGAALMFAFTLGTSPVFFLVAYLTTQIGARLESWFMRFVAVVVLVLGLVTLNSGLNLMGSPLSFSNLTARPFATRPATAEPPGAAPTAVAGPAVPSPAAGVTLELRVANSGYFPATLYASAGQPLTLALVTNRTTSCARDFVIPGLRFYQLLPTTGRVTVDVPPQKAGTVLRFACSMGMYTGKIVFE